MEHVLREFILDRIIYHDETDNEICAVVHDADFPENSFSLYMMSYLLPDETPGSLLKGILAMDYVRTYEKRSGDALMHVQPAQARLNAVVEITQILDSTDLLVRTDLDDKLLLVEFEIEVPHNLHDVIYVSGELHLKDQDEIEDILYYAEHYPPLQNQT